MLKITKIEAQWLLSALTTHIETCEELMAQPEVGNLQYQLLNHQRGNYAGLRTRLENAVKCGTKTIRIEH